MSKTKCPKILLVDDNADDVLFVRLALERLGISHSLETLSDGDDAIHYLEGIGHYSDRIAFPIPALLLLDLEMPRKNGFEVLRWVRSSPAIKMLPITVFTGCLWEPHLLKAYELGANSFLLKPFGMEQFYAIIKTVTDFWLDTCRLPTAPRPSPI